MLGSQLIGALLFISGMIQNFWVLQGLATVISFGVPFFIYKAVTKEKIADIIPLKNPGATNVFLTVCMSLFAVPPMMLVSAASSVFFENNASVFLEEMKSFPVSAAIITAAVLPALFEEISFRGVVLKNLSPLGIKKAAVFSGFLFALMHMDPQQFPYAFIMGVFLACLVWYTRSVLTAVLSHFCVNAASIFIGYFSSGDEIPFPFVPALIISVPAFFFAMKFFISHNKTRITDEMPLDEKTADHKILTWELWFAVIFYVLIAVRIFI